MQGRQAPDNVLIANELIDSRKWSKKAGVILKINMEKADDHVEWDFVLYTIRRIGFGDWWCECIRECISSASFSVLVNGSPSKLFKSV